MGPSEMGVGSGWPGVGLESLGLRVRGFLWPLEFKREVLH